MSLQEFARGGPVGVELGHSCGRHICSCPAGSGPNGEPDLREDPHRALAMRALRVCRVRRRGHHRMTLGPATANLDAICFDELPRIYTSDVSSCLAATGAGPGTRGSGNLMILSSARAVTSLLRAPR